MSSVIKGSIDTSSPIYYRLASDMHLRIVSIPVRMKNHYPVPVAITHINIPMSVATVISITDLANNTRFLVSDGRIHKQWNIH